MSADPASGGSPVLLRSGPPGLPEAGGGPRQREDGGPGGRGRRPEPRAGAERQGGGIGAGRPAALGRALADAQLGSEETSNFAEWTF